VSSGIPTRTIGALLGLAGFIVAILAGMAAGNEAGATILRALAALIVCNLIGLVIGAVGERVVQDHVSKHKQANPVGSIERADSAGSADANDGIIAA